MQLDHANSPLSDQLFAEKGAQGAFRSALLCASQHHERTSEQGTAGEVQRKSAQSNIGDLVLSTRGPTTDGEHEVDESCSIGPIDSHPQG